MPTKIEWTNETWNPITGCTPISEGCKNCYAKRMANRLKGRFGYSKKHPFKVMLRPDRLSNPCHWHKPKMVFVCSMSDLFHKDVPFHYIEKVFLTMFNYPKHIFQILTKRPDRLKKFLDYNPTILMALCNQHIWYGITAENQKRFDERMDIFQYVYVKTKFVSLEPMLGEINIKQHKDHINWVICGGETGSGARLIDPLWVLMIKEQCKQYEIPFFFKQWNKKGNRKLLGKEWNEMPNMEILK